ncbi:type IV pilus twitching motility protein PilT [Sporolactobacillus sp. Y61]|jgi:twitching motility protein PilT|uniref:Type IV pilus twitching motility protein PilT n=1 Tax=Sporolactobacillus sp. Y61 TaxID=3160863 RepID=A0AAU8IEW7_9BACL|nr:type IV pilus twitching motility protein PilT [Sporolactobacillus sp. THM19-2]RYL94724.1 type IV pilus twitching motility protein PilT [Sporolactobacillus sp. THM19-2]
MKQSLKEWLIEACSRRASDLHVSVGIPPTIRLNGELVSLDLPPVTPSDTESAVQSLLADDQYHKLSKYGELDFSCSIPGLSRFRVNAFRQRNCYSLAFRVIPQHVPDLTSLQLPEVLASLCHRPHGLFLVTGPTGSGKSTTLAALVDDMNKNMRRHIITLEDPIEYLHRHNKCIIQQREIGNDTQSFSKGLRSALREDPDVILVGEMRDLETIRTALTAAETGHLVLATLHTNDAISTVDRIIDVFPPDQQGQIRIQLATELVAVVSQHLFPTPDYSGRRVATEVMINNKAISHLIREKKIYQIPSVIQMNRSAGMQTMASCIKDMLANRAIAAESVEKFLLKE